MVLMLLTPAEWCVLSAMSVLQGCQIWAEWLCVAQALEVERMELMASFHRKLGKRPNLQCRSYRSGIAPGFRDVSGNYRRKKKAMDKRCNKHFEQVDIGRISCVHRSISATSDDVILVPSDFFQYHAHRIT